VLIPSSLGSFGLEKIKANSYLLLIQFLGTFLRRRSLKEFVHKRVDFRVEDLAGYEGEPKGSNPRAYLCPLLCVESSSGMTMM